MVPFLQHDLPPVTDAEMARLYEKLKTPVKHGAAVKFENDFTDSPSVFYRDGMYYMYFISISKDCTVSGYETHLAKSADLLHWETVGTIFRRNELNHWDSKQCAGYAAFIDIAFDGSYALQQVNGKYYSSYLAGNSDGYEPDPLYMGLSHTDDPIDPDSFVRFEEPILRPEDADARPQESKTLYKSFLFKDDALLTGHPYVNIYNGKAQDNRECLLLAVSDDGEHWERYGDGPVIDLISGDPREYINGDAQIVKIDDVYVAIFFRLHAGRGAFNTFAASRDLVHWNIWQGTPLIEPEHPWENEHAHKVWFVRRDGINYHFYCAVNSQNERFIAVATSE